MSSAQSTFRWWQPVAVIAPILLVGAGAVGWQWHSEQLRQQRMASSVFDDVSGRSAVSSDDLAAAMVWRGMTPAEQAEQCRIFAVSPSTMRAAFVKQAGEARWQSWSSTLVFECA